MAFKIIWSKTAIQQLDETIDYLEKEWSDKELSNFFNRLEESLTAIQENPNTYKNSYRKQGLKEFQVTSHNTIFYTVNANTINIVTFWANKKR